MEHELVVAGAVALGLLVLVRFKGCEEAVNALGEAIVDDALVLERLYLVSSVVAFLVYLGLFGADERLLVDVWVNFDVAVVGELEGILMLLAWRCETGRIEALAIRTHLL